MELKTQWLQRTKQWPTRQADCIAKIEHFNNKNKHHLNKWTGIQKCENEAKIKEFCAKSASRNQEKIDRCKNKQSRSAAAIVFYASLIALIALGMIVHFTGLDRFYPAMIAMVVLPIVFTTVELGMLVIYKFIKIDKIKKLDLLI